METASHLDTVVFDKTGTLTVGKPELQSVQSLSSQFTELKIMEMAVALEKESRHPLAQAVLSSAKARGTSTITHHVVFDTYNHLDPASDFCQI